MAQPPSLPGGDLDRIYSHRIRPDFLDGIAPSSTPTAVIVRGQPGAGTAYALERVRTHMASSAGAAAVIAARALREYHSLWRARAPSTPLTSDRTSSDVRDWTDRLIGDAISRQVNVLMEASLSHGEPERMAALATRFKDVGYQVATVTLATDRDQSRQATIAGYVLARMTGVRSGEVDAPKHDAAYDQLRESLYQIEFQVSADRVQVVTTDGRQLYANQVENGRWVREPRAAYVVDDFRERKLTARELADSALRWQILVDRLAGDPSAPAELTSQAVRWHEEATARALGDPDASKLLTWGREGQAFRSMNRYDFQRQFPQHADSVQRLQEAVTFAEMNFAEPSDRRRFIEQTRRRLAERIAEGRADAPVRTKDKAKMKEPKAR